MDSYVECLVKQKPKMFKKFVKYLNIFITVLLAAASFLLPIPTVNLVLFIAAIGFGVLAYFSSLNSELEFEYLYCDREITVDKILSQQKRKKAGKYEIDKMEIFAPLDSYKLDEYKNRKYKVYDFSSGVEGRSGKYALYFEGQKMIILEPSEAFIKAVYNVAPRKVIQN
ncbi:MAG: DUF6106 family protein [Lachnospiraceae bacterium]|nr:DUF6106 family protein [Lachnospiraceae bacterium]